MTKQHSILFVIALLMSVCSGLSAQNTTINFEGKYKDVIIPSTSKPYLRLIAKGGDGGKIQRNSQWGGGQGATVIAYFTIGTDATQIKAGGTLRFMIGGKGDSKTDMNDADVVGVGGGGGTGIAYKAPGQDNWKLLLVAGGGGGAQWSGLFGGQKGGPGKAYDKEMTGDGGSNTVTYNASPPPLPKRTVTDSRGSGAGAYANADQWKDDVKSYAGWEGGPNTGVPTGGSGHDAGRTYYYSGGWGFGAGGIGNRGDYSALCGGGGGFTGGAIGGRGKDKSEGGTSYVNEDHMEVSAINSSSGGSTTSPQHGYASYEFASITASAINWHSGRGWCIDNSSGSATDDSKIQLWTCGVEKSSQKWAFLPDFTIRLGSDLNKCLDLTGGNASNNTNIQLHNCNGSGAQKWIFEGTSRMIRYHDDLGFCLTMDKHNASNSSNIYLYECSTGNIGQQWNRADFSAAYTSGSTVKSIRPDYAPDKAFDKTGVNAEDAKIWLWDYNSSNTNQQWIINGFTIRLKKEINSTQMCVDLPSRNTKNGQDLQIHHCNNTEAQEWIYDGVFKAIRYAKNPSMCIDVENASSANKAIVQLWDCKQIQAQRFLLK